MNINSRDLEAAIAKAHEVSDHYDLTHISGGDPQRYMDYLLESCTALGVGRVEMFEVDISFSTSAVYSMCVMQQDGTSHIVLAKELNQCWKRYCVCKELFHILIDKEEYRNLDVFSHTESVAVDFQLDDSNPEPSVSAEFLAEVAAMEFLFPYAKREAILAGSKSPDFLNIAIQYRIPQILVDRYLSKNRMEPLAPYKRQNP